MLPNWALICIVAALLQNLRSGTQRQLSGKLSITGAASTRFLFGLPFAALYLVVLLQVTGAALPQPTPRFAGLVVTGAMAQIVATALLLACFALNSFAVGTTYSKTEGIQAALFGFVVLGDRISAGGLVGIVASMLGVMLVSLKGRQDARPVSFSHGAIPGLASGALFAVSAVCYRGAALELGNEDFAVRAAVTLVTSLGLQCLVLTVYLQLRERGELSRIKAQWRRGVLAGATGAAASAGWFTAFTLASAAYVKAVGSVELIFAMLTSWLMFRETPTRFETAGALLVMLGVIVTVLSA